MISIIPDGFNAFRCKGGACRHTCCQVWEIDIDPDTADRYLHLSGKLGEEMKQAMARSADGTWYFKLNAQGYCHFLDPDGLCRVYKELGEDALCDICTVHPRFFTYVEDTVLCGTGLCCEKTCEILRDLPGKLLFTEEETGTRYDFPQLLDFLGWDISPEESHFAPRPDAAYYQKILTRLAKTEPIDNPWTRDMEELPKSIPQLVRETETAIKEKKFDPDFLTRIYQFIFYRQMDKADIYGLENLAAYARESTDFITLMAAHRGDLLEQTRRFSEQIEYDTDNVDILLESMEEE